MEWAGLVYANVAALSGLAAAFVGAWAAFQLESTRRERADRQVEAAGLQQLVFLLSLQWSTVYQFWKEYLAEHELNEHREFWVPAAILSSPIEDFYIGKRELSGILKDAYDDLPFLVVQANQRAKTFGEEVAKRAEFHEQVYQEELKKLKSDVSGSHSLDELINGISFPTRSQLKRRTDLIYEMSRATLTALERAVAVATVVSKKRFPESKLITLNKPRKNANMPSAAEGK